MRVTHKCLGRVAASAGERSGAESEPTNSGAESEPTNFSWRWRAGRESEPWYFSGGWRSGRESDPGDFGGWRSGRESDPGDFWRLAVGNPTLGTFGGWWSGRSGRESDPRDFSGGWQSGRFLVVGSQGVSLVVGARGVNPSSRTFRQPAESLICQGNVVASRIFFEDGVSDISHELSMSL